jgi:hypothetical protein
LALNNLNSGFPKKQECKINGFFVIDNSFPQISKRSFPQIPKKSPADLADYGSGGKNAFHACLSKVGPSASKVRGA